MKQLNRNKKLSSLSLG